MYNTNNNQETIFFWDDEAPAYSKQAEQKSGEQATNPEPATGES